MFATLQSAYLAALAIAQDLPPLIVWVPYLVVLLAAAATGYRLRGHLWLEALVLASLVAAGTGVLNLVWSSLGMPADFSGVTGSLLLALFSAPFIVVLSLAGVSIGALSRRLLS